MKIKVFKKMNESFGRTLPRTVKARAGSIIIGLVFNMPDSEKYEDDVYTGKGGIVRRYDLKVDLTLEMFSKTYLFGFAYGVVLAVGVGVASDVKIGDKVMLRSMPEDTLIYNGKIFHVIREVDIAAIVEESNKELESSNG